jgi:hypothetical protein
MGNDYEKTNNHKTLCNMAYESLRITTFWCKKFSALAKTV